MPRPPSRRLATSCRSRRKRDMVRDPRDDVITDWSEQEIRRGLAVLIRQLRNAVTATAQQEKDGALKLKKNELARLRRHQRHFLPGIPRSVKALDHPDPNRRRERLYDLYAALGAVAAIYGHRVEDPILERLHTTPATKKRLDKVREPEVTNIICEEFGIFRKRHPDWKPNTPRRGAHYVAKIIYKPVNNRVTKLIRVKKKTPGLRPDTIARYLRKQYPNLFKSD